MQYDFSHYDDVIELFSSIAVYHDEPKLYSFITRLVDPHSIGAKEADDNIGRAGGASLSKERAYAKTIGESCERFAQIPSENERYLKSTYENLCSEGKNCLDPNTIVAGTKRDKQGSNNSLFKWILGTDLKRNVPAWIPAQLVDMPHFYDEDEEIIRASITTGGACFNSFEGAALRGFLEIIERDAFMIAWLSKIKLERIETDWQKLLEINSCILSKTIDVAFQYQLRPEFFLLPTRTSAIVVLCVVWDETGIGPKYSLGAKASFSMFDSMLGAVEEALQLRPWLRGLIDSTEKITFNDCPNNLAERGIHSLSIEGITVLKEWLDEGTTVQINESDCVRSDSIDDDSFLSRKLTQEIIKEGCSPFVVDLSNRLPRKVRDKGHVVIKAIVPEYQPLYLTEDLKDIAWQRLGNPDDVQIFPHPFL